MQTILPRLLSMSSRSPRLLVGYSRTLKMESVHKRTAKRTAAGRSSVGDSAGGTAVDFAFPRTVSPKREWMSSSTWAPSSPPPQSPKPPLGSRSTKVSACKQTVEAGTK